MNFFNRPRKLAAFLLTVALLLQFCTSQTDAARVLSKKAHSSPGTMASSSSSSETLKGGEEALKNVDSSLRKIPPSRSNPTQNKATPAELVRPLAPMLVDHKVGRAVGTYAGLPPCGQLK
nr:Tyrosine recombinase [Ipomoea batatas]